jgi:hypothetical protein
MLRSFDSSLAIMATRHEVWEWWPSGAVVMAIEVSWRQMS